MQSSSLLSAMAALGAMSFEDIFKYIPQFRGGTPAKKNRTPNQSKKRTYSYMGNNQFRCRQTRKIITEYNWITREQMSERLAKKRARK